MHITQSKGLVDSLGNSASYKEAYDEAVRSLETLPWKELIAKYSYEYHSWSARKHWAKSNQVVWDDHLKAFKDFLLHMGPVPNTHLPKKLRWTLDRINSTGGYTLENLRWASKETQSKNRTSTRCVFVDGKPMNMTEISNATGKKYNAVRQALNRHGNEYASVLIEKANSDENAWNFPEEYVDVEELEAEYQYQQKLGMSKNRLRFFVALTKNEFYRLGFKASLSMRPEMKAYYAEIIAYLRSLHNKAVEFSRECAYKRVLRLKYGQIKLPNSEMPPDTAPPWDKYFG